MQTQRDYILRLIEEFARVVARLHFLKVEGREAEARELFGATAGGFPELERLLGRDAARDEVLAVCGAEAFSPEMAVVLAGLLMEGGLLGREGTEAQDRRSLRYALWLYEAAVSERATVPLDVYQRIALLREYVAEDGAGDGAPPDPS